MKYRFIISGKVDIDAEKDDARSILQQYITDNLADAEVQLKLEDDKSETLKFGDAAVTYCEER